MLVGQHQGGATDPDFGVADAADRVGDPGKRLLGSEGLLVEVDRPAAPLMMT
jgi:hypothetical protein